MVTSFCCGVGVVWEALSRLFGVVLVWFGWLCHVFVVWCWCGLGGFVTSLWCGVGVVWVALSCVCGVVLVWSVARFRGVVGDIVTALWCGVSVVGDIVTALWCGLGGIVTS